ncbi:MAG: HAD family hydrolase [Chloroflexi bacterium]|nr:HAD family hydrolase [Chloroflexota bacterium]
MQRINLDGYQLIIFDKDGTLIDFHAMWGGWMRDVAARLEASCQLPISQLLFASFGYDSASRRVLPGAPLAMTPMATLRSMAGEALREAGCPPSRVESALHAAWHIPDPVATARPLADLGALFGELRARDMKIAVATTDDRTPTERTLAAFGVAAMVNTMICADDGVTPKPAPDMVLAICERLDVPPLRTVMIGDTVADMQMGRAAGSGLVIGVASGISPAEVLAPHADVILESVADLF